MKNRMVGLALKMMVAKKWRTFFSILGVVFGVGLLVAMLVMQSKMDHALQQQFEAHYGNSDLMVGYRLQHKLLNAEQIKKIQDFKGVAASGQALVSPQWFKPAKTMHDTGIYYIGVDNSDIIKSAYQFHNSLQPHEVVLTERLAKRLGAQVGAEAMIPFADGETMKWKVAEILPDKVSASGALPDMAIFELTSLQEAFGLQGQVNLMYLKLGADEQKQQVASRLQTEVDKDLDIDLEEAVDAAKRNITSMKVMEDGLGVLALFTSALFMLSNFQLSLQDRVRELATLRAVAATRKQIFTLVMAEAMLIGGIGVLAGIAVGLVLANQLSDVVAAWMQVAVVEAPLPVLPLVLITVGSWVFFVLLTMIPARKTTRILPIQAAREVTTQNLELSAGQGKTALFFAVAGAFLLGIGTLLSHDTSAGAKLLCSMIGGLLFVIGLFVSTPYAVKPILLFVAPLVERLGGRVSFVAIRNLIAERKQSAMTIMVIATSLTLLITVSTLLQSIRVYQEQLIRQTYVTDLVVSSSAMDLSSLPYEVKSELAAVPGVRAVIPVSASSTRFLAGFDFSHSNPEWLQKNSQMEMGHKNSESIEYRLADLRQMEAQGLIPKLNVSLQRAAVITKEYADNLGVKVGDRLELTAGDRPGLPKTPLTVAVIVDHFPSIPVTFNSVLVDWSNTSLQEEVVWNRPDIVVRKLNVSSFLVDINKQQQERVQLGLIALQKKYPELKWSTLQTAIDELNQEMGQRFALLWSVVGIVLLVGVLGLGNTLSANLHAKRREYAILRAIRITSSELIMTVLTQSLLFVMMAVLLGGVTGYLMAYAFLSGMAEAAMVIPWQQHLLIVGIVFVCTLLISLPLAYRQGRKTVIVALTME